MKHVRWTYFVGLVLALVAGIWAVNAQSGGGRHVPRFVVEPGWPKPGPRSWVTDRLVTEEMGATCADAKGTVVSLNRGNMLPIEKSLTLKSAPPIIEFDPSGHVVKAWGDRSVLPEGLHGCLFDHENNFWLGGSGDGIVQKWTRDGSRMLMQIGTKGKCDGPDGKCGNPGLNASHTLLNQPADMAVDPTNGDIYIADGYGNHRIVVFDRNGQYLRQWGSAGTGPGQFSPPDGGHPHCVVLNRGLLYVCDRGNARIQVFDRMGSLKEIIEVKPGSGEFGSSSDLDFSPDSRFMYINDHEEELKLRGNVPGDRYLHDLLRQYQPGWALARQWAGFEREVEELQKEIARLRGLVSRAVYELKDAGAEDKSRRLLRALDGR